MGTRFDVVFPGMETSFAQSIFNEIKTEVQRLEKKLSRFLSESIIYEINQNAGKKDVNVDKEVWEVLTICEKYYHATLGFFDISIFPLMQLWKIKDEGMDKNIQPSGNEICNKLEITGMKHVRLNSENFSVKFDRSGIEIDLGGFGKGYALEQVKNIIKKHNVKNAFISFGESSILALGHHPFGKNWEIGIQHIFEPGNSVFTFQMKDSSLSTSGISYFNKQVEIKKFGHVINPKTGYPVKGLRTVSVTSGSPVKAEILSTALLVADFRDKPVILQNFPGCRAVEIDYEKNRKASISYLN